MLRPGLVERCYADGEALLRQGDHGTQLLYLVEGTVDVLLRLAPAREQAPPDASPSPIPDPNQGGTAGARSPGCAAGSGARGDGCAAEGGKSGEGSRGEDRMSAGLEDGPGGEVGRVAGGSSGGSAPPAVPEIVGDELPPALLEVGNPFVHTMMCIMRAHF